MISKHITCKVENDNYRRLAKYIADASHAGEKCLLSWCAGAWSKDDYDFAIEEVEDTQILNSRTAKEKTYHLIVSFRIEDEQKLTQEDFKNIEERFALALGFNEHQRHCGVHINTDNMHLHIAYNMIHIDKLTRHEPFQEYHIRDKLCRNLEKKYGLSIDNGIDLTTSPLSANKLSSKSATKESLSGEESFERFVMDHHEVIMELLGKSQTWEEIHHTFALYGLEIKQRANGLIIKNRKGRQCLKASAFDRSVSYKKLSERFGIFTPIQEKEVEAQDWYKKKSLHKNPYEKELWSKFSKLTRLTKQNKLLLQAEISAIEEKYRKEKIRIISLPVGKKNKAPLMKMVNNKEAMEKTETRKKYDIIKQDNWLDFLQEKALNGDENALAVLRSKKEHVKPDKEQDGIFFESYSRHLNEHSQFLDNRSEFLDKKDNILKDTDTSHKSKKILLAVAVMKSVFGGKEENFKYKITRNGDIIFDFGNGKKVIDNGQKISYTDKAKNLAIDYATVKFGMKELSLERKELITKKEISYDDIKQTQKGLER